MPCAWDGAGRPSSVKEDHIDSNLRQCVLNARLHEVFQGREQVEKSLSEVVVARVLLYSDVVHKTAVCHRNTARRCYLEH